MRRFKAVFERDHATDYYVGYIPGFAGAHSQGQTPEELRANLAEVVKMLLKNGEPILPADFIGTETIMI